MVWVLAGAVAAALTLLVLAVVLFLRARRQSGTAAGRMNGRGPGALVRLRDDERARTLATLATTLELDEVLSQMLRVAASVPGIDAAIVKLSDAEGGPLLATLGLSREEASVQPFPDLLDRGERRALVSSYLYAPRENGSEPELISGGLFVPLAAGEESKIGVLGVFWRGASTGPSDGTLLELEELAARAAPAIENTRRFRAARELAYLDPVTGLRNHRFFHEVLAREVKRAQRHDRRLAILVFDIDDFKSINDRIGHLAGDAALAEVAELLLSVMRGTDVACRVGGDEFAIILPESGIADAEQLYLRLQAALAGRTVGPGEPLRLSAGIAEHRPDDSPLYLFERADRALFRAKEAGKGQGFAEDNP